MRQLYLLITTIFLTLPAWADINPERLLNKVTLQLHSEQWVTTKTALVNVGVSAAVSGQGIEKIQNEVMQKLNQLAGNTEWHIVSYDRQLDKSGLESIQITAQARVFQSDLTGMRDKAKSISKPGETFSLDNVQFTPSEDETRQANIVLRNNLYQQAKAEIDSLNRIYPDQKYYLHSIDFLVPPLTAPVAMTMLATDVSARKMATPLSIGNKQELQATVVLASMPEHQP